MKNIFIGLTATVFGVTLGIAHLQGAQAKSKESKDPAKGEHFDMSGTIKKVEMDICMVPGLHYWLHPKKGEDVRYTRPRNMIRKSSTTWQRTIHRSMLRPHGTSQYNVITFGSQTLERSNNVAGASIEDAGPVSYHRAF
jgi:hypothetical protein